MFGQVLARNFFATGIPHAEILSRYMVLYVAFFGAVLAVEGSKHIRIDVVAACMKPERHPPAATAAVPDLLGTLRSNDLGSHTVLV